MTTIKERANAKINLYLDVLSKREDGFHDIKTVMHSVNFGDEITVTAVPSEKTSVRVEVIGARFLPLDNRNLAVRAAYLFLEKAKLTEEVTIKLVKRLPVAAGLAGGSSDAAAVLRAMNKIHSKLFTVPALTAISAELGSDVAYCLYGKTALCEGRGEKITKLPVKIKETFVTLLQKLATFIHSFKSLLDIISVKEETVYVLHIKCKESHLKHLFFCNKAGWLSDGLVGDKYIEVASVVTNKETCFFRNIFLTNYLNLG